MREGHQRVAAGVDAERGGAQRILAQRDEGAAPGRAQRSTTAASDNSASIAEAEEIEVQRACAVDQPNSDRPRDAVDPVDAAGQPLLVAQHQKDQQS